MDIDISAKLIKIGYVVSSLNYGGVEKYVVDLVNRIDRRCFEPIIFSFKPDGPLKTQLKRGVKIHELQKGKGNDFVLPVKMARLFRKEEIDIIHSNNWSTFAESAAARWIAFTPAMLHAQHGLEMNDTEAFLKMKRYKRNMMRRTLTYFTDQIVTVSNATKKFVCDEWKTPEKKVKTIYNGVDFISLTSPFNLRKKVRKNLGIDEDDLVIGSVGRLMKVKNYPSLIKAFASLSVKNPNLKLMLIGDGPEKEYLTALIKGFYLDDKAMLLGHRSDVRELLVAMDIFILPSFSEGISISLLEAMAASLPVVVTEVGGNPEVIENNISGIIVPPDDSEVLANVMWQLVNQTVRRQNLGVHARNRVEKKFNLNRCVKEYEDLYFSLTS